MKRFFVSLGLLYALLVYEFRDLKEKRSVRVPLHKECIKSQAMPQYNYVGCFKDKKEKRYLPFLQSRFAVTVEKCRWMCGKAKYKYAGLQNGIECWCGDNYDAGMCEKTCLNGAKNCGGESANSIYTSKLAAEEEQVEIAGSSVECTGSNRYERMCTFTDTFMTFQKSKRIQIIFVKTRNSTISGLPLLSEAKEGELLTNILQLGTMPIYTLDILVVSTPPEYDTCLSSPALIMARFLPSNIMHTFHDDLLNLYFTLRHHYLEGVNLVFADKFGAGEYIYLFQKFGTVLHTSELGMIRFSKLYAGLKKIANWYQYGYDRPQGPIAGKTVRGSWIRQFTKDLTERIETNLNFVRGAAPLDRANQTMPEFDLNDNSLSFALLISRKKDRRILNEAQVLDGISKVSNLTTLIVRLEEHPLNDIIKILKRTKLMIAIHGSALILGIFLPKGAKIVELFPYAVPATNYTPYKTMCELPGIDLVYRYWENKQIKNTIGYPNRIKTKGGLQHLDIQTRKRIIESDTVPEHLCCSDPYWLYKIYQDTYVSTDFLAQI